jgi:hypothetical protein
MLWFLDVRLGLTVTSLLIYSWFQEKRLKRTVGAILDV